MSRGSATVTYDDTQIDLKTIKATARECGYHCAGAILPKHVCAPEDPPSAAMPAQVHAQRPVPHAEHAKRGMRCHVLLQSQDAVA